MNIETQELFDKMRSTLDEYINKLEKKIRTYGSFNVIANSTARNHFRYSHEVSTDIPGTKPTTPEYIALICLKFPFSMGIGEFTQARMVAEDLHTIDEFGE